MPIEFHRLADVEVTDISAFEMLCTSHVGAVDTPQIVVRGEVADIGQDALDTVGVALRRTAERLR